MQRGVDLAAFERTLGVHVEPALHAWARGSDALMLVAGLVYFIAHVAVTGWALVWTWCLRRDAFAAVRDLFVVTQCLTAALWMLLPTAPPRLLPGGSATPLDPGAVAGLVQSPFAAMPSGHVAFALVAGVTFARIGDRRWLRAFGWAYPPLIVAVTVVTGHHLWLDGLGAAAVVAAAAALVRCRRAVTPVTAAVAGAVAPGRSRP